MLATDCTKNFSFWSILRRTVRSTKLFPLFLKTKALKEIVPNQIPYQGYLMFVEYASERRQLFVCLSVLLKTVHQIENVPNYENGKLESILHYHQRKTNEQN